MEFVIITGMSGAGKSRAALVLEDMGYFVVDNLPAPLIPKFAELSMEGKGKSKGVALVCDVRSGADFSGLFLALDELREMGCPYRILYMDADDTTIIRRYKETRRRHPLDQGGDSLAQSINLERSALMELRLRADHVIDTTDAPTTKTRGQLLQLFGQGEGSRQGMEVRVASFGFKHGTPIDADLVFDVRFLPNPYYDMNLRSHNGLESAVRDYVFAGGQAEEFMSRLQNLLGWLLPRYVAEGKLSLVIAVGCTGGKHRSVAIAHALADYVKDQGYSVTESHRDLGKH